MIDGAKRSTVLLSLPLLLALTTSAAPSQQASPHSALVGAADFADPFVLRDGDSYYAFATGTRVRGEHVQVARSSDLTTWTRLTDALPLLPTWASREDGLTWAPAVLKRPKGYVLYYTAHHAALDFQCISRATSPFPQGPYIDDSSQPFVCDSARCGSIDPSAFVDDAGRAYLLWKSDENAKPCHADSRIWAQALADDGLAVKGAAAQLLAMDRAWERPLVEGPSMIMREGRYFLFYSANWYESADYAIGYATCTGPLGPCEKVTKDAPFFRSAGTMLGPGGQEFFDDPSGATWMTYHAWNAPHATYAAGGTRALRVARVKFVDGTPSLVAR